MKQFSKTLVSRAVKAAADISDQQLSAINRHTLADFDREQLYVRTFFVCHNAIDRDGEFFSDELLSEFEKTLPGKGCFIKHPQGYDGESAPGEGLWFEAKLRTLGQAEARTLLGEPSLTWVDDSAQAKVLEASMYMVRHAENDYLLSKLDAGIAGHCSIGFSAAARDSVRNSDNKHMADKWLAPGEALECSLVWLGAQPGARAYKSAGSDNADDADNNGPQHNHQASAAQASVHKSTLNYCDYLGDHPMHLKNKALQGQIEGLKTGGSKNTEADLATAMLILSTTAGELEQAEKALTDAETAHAGLKADVDTLANLKTALGDQAEHLLANPEALAASVKAAGEARTALVDEIVTTQRTKGLVGDDDAAVAAAKKDLEGQNLKQLNMLKTALGSATSGSQIAGGASAGTGADTDKGGQKDLGAL